MAKNWTCVKDDKGNIVIDEITANDIAFVENLNSLCIDPRKDVQAPAPFVLPIAGTPCVTIFHQDSHTTRKMTAEDVGTSLKNIFGKTSDKDLIDSAHKKAALIEAAEALGISSSAYAPSLDYAA